MFGPVNKKSLFLVTLFTLIISVAAAQSFTLSTGSQPTDTYQENISVNASTPVYLYDIKVLETSIVNETDSHIVYRFNLSFEKSGFGSWVYEKSLNGSSNTSKNFKGILKSNFKGQNRYQHKNNGKELKRENAGNLIKSLHNPPVTVESGKLYSLSGYSNGKVDLSLHQETRKTLELVAGFNKNSAEGLTLKIGYGSSKFTADAACQAGWMLNETSSPSLDFCNGNDGVWNGDPSSTSGWKVSSDSQDLALDFDGTGDYLNIGQGSGVSPDTGNFSWGWAMKHPSVSNRRDFWSRDITGGGMEVGLESDGSLRVFLKDDAGNTVDVDSDSTWDNNTFVTVVVNWNNDQNEISFYVNGTEKSKTYSSQQNVGNLSSSVSGDAFIGAFVDGSREWNGLIDEPRLWNKVLNSTEIDNYVRCGDVGNYKADCQNVAGNSNPSFDAIASDPVNWSVDTWTDISVNASDPDGDTLSAEYRFLFQNGTVLVDWTDLSSSTGNANDFEKNFAFRPNQTGDYSLRINVSDGNGGWNTSITNQTIFGPPEVTLGYPANGKNFATSFDIIDFNANASDDLQLTQMTLYANFSGSWQGFNATSVSGTTANTTITRNVSQGFYKWNFRATDNNSNSVFADSNRTFTVPSPSTFEDPVIHYINTTPSTWRLDDSIDVATKVTDAGDSIDWVQATAYKNGSQVAQENLTDGDADTEYDTTDLFTTNESADYNLSIKAVDTDGNTSFSSTSQFVTSKPKGVASINFVSIAEKSPPISWRFFLSGSNKNASYNYFFEGSTTQTGYVRLLEKNVAGANTFVELDNVSVNSIGSFTDNRLSIVLDPESDNSHTYTIDSREQTVEVWEILNPTSVKMSVNGITNFSASEGDTWFTKQILFDKNHFNSLVNDVDSENGVVRLDLASSSGSVTNDLGYYDVKAVFTTYTTKFTYNSSTVRVAVGLLPFFELEKPVRGSTVLIPPGVDNRLVNFKSQVTLNDIGINRTHVRLRYPNGTELESNNISDISSNSILNISRNMNVEQDGVYTWWWEFTDKKEVKDHQWKHYTVNITTTENTDNVNPEGPKPVKENKTIDTNGDNQGDTNVTIHYDLDQPDNGETLELKNLTSDTVKFKFSLGVENVKPDQYEFRLIDSTGSTVYTKTFSSSKALFEFEVPGDSLNSGSWAASDYDFYVNVEFAEDEVRTKQYGFSVAEFTGRPGFIGLLEEEIYNPTRSTLLGSNLWGVTANQFNSWFQILILSTLFIILVIKAGIDAKIAGLFTLTAAFVMGWFSYLTPSLTAFTTIIFVALFVKWVVL